MRILLVSPYHGGSHAAWAAGWARHSRHEVVSLTLPARFWKWRMYGAAGSLARQVPDVGPVDLVVATDMVDLAAFLGLARRSLLGVPAVLYLHENQVTYPQVEGAPSDDAYGFVNWRSMDAADEVWFNSRFHRDEVADALPRLLRRFPDERHDHWVDEVLGRSRVMPVGLEVGDLTIGPKGDPPLVLWNHRWEHDKDPPAFFAALDEIGDLPWRLALVGESFRNEPAEFEAARRRWSDRLVAYGHEPRDRYASLLADAAVVVSTSRQEFFGISILEAAAAGAVPLVPDRLSYPTVIPSEVHDRVLYDGPVDLAVRLRAVLTGHLGVPGLARAIRDAYAWEVVAASYDDRCEELVASGGSLRSP